MLEVPRCFRVLAHVSAALAALVLWSPGVAAQKTDVIILTNGDQVTCEIRELERGRLRCKTDAMGTVQIQWDHIADIKTDKTLEVEMESGARFFGAIQPGDTPDRIPFWRVSVARVYRT